MLNLKTSDNLDFMRDMADESVQLIVTSPPYNIGKEYETQLDLQHYVEDQKTRIVEMSKKLKSKGSICWQVGNYVKNGEVIPLDILTYDIFKGLGFKLRNRIVWHFGHGLHCKRRFSGRYETILWFTRDERYTFNLDPVRVPSKYPGKRHYKGPKKGQLSGNPKGKNPSDVWDIPNVKHNHVEKTAHPCQFPVGLAERLVLSLSDENDLVFDPYMGSGSTIIAALKNNRKAAGCDTQSKYVDITRGRVKELEKGTLKTRHMNERVK